MFKFLRLYKTIAPASLAFLFLYTTLAFGQGMEVDYLSEIAKVYYIQDKFNDAFSEFSKVLSIDPQNQQAREYIAKINKELGYEDDMAEQAWQKAPLIKEQEEPVLSKNEAMSNVLTSLESLEKNNLDKEVAGKKVDGFVEGEIDQLDRERHNGILLGGLRLSGEMLLSAGATPKDFIWKRANYDLNEKNFRVLSENAYDNRFNTFDTRVYDSLSVNLDTENKSGVNFHTNVTVDPWSFTGKSEKITVTSAFGDPVEIELRYWSNTGYTINNTVYSKVFGNTFAIPELKVKNGSTDHFTANGAFFPADSISVPALKINNEFQPVREMWFDYANGDGGLKLRVFPIAYQDQAFLSDDPLRITNHHIWWAASPWLKRYSPGNLNSGAVPVDFTKGFWDDTFSNVRDSTGKYLTALRGFSFTMGAPDETSFSTTVATPKDLWQDYGEVDNYITASRFKHYALDNLSLGGTFTSRTGLNVYDKYKADSQNYVGGADLSYEIIEGVKTQAELLTSQSYYDQTDSQYKSEARGNAYYFTVVNRYPQKEIISLTDAYNESKKDKEETFMMKSKFFVARMDEGFDSALSEYKDTRDDVFWSRHISFRKPFGYFSPGLSSAYMDEEALNATRIGDGIDSGRSVLGFRIEAFYEDSAANLFDVRNVHKTNGKYVETVVRDEMMFKPIDKLTLRGLLLYHNLPKTKAGIDPFDIDPDTGIGLANTAVPDGADPSLKTGSLGLEYAFEEYLKANLVWERTNDYYLAYGNFPNGVFNSAELSRIFSENGNTYRGWNRFLFDQGIFEQAPYPFYNIYKAGLDFSPVDKVNIYMDYTYNEFKMAGQNSDTMNHIGLQMVYEPTKKTGLALRYTYSMWKNPVLVNQGNTKTSGHHNFFGEFRYLPSKDDELTIQYGEGNSSSFGRLYDPTGGSLLTIDTAHIFRAYYRRKF